MAEPVTPRDWRRRKPGSHTREVRSEHLPDEVGKAMLAMAESIASANFELIDAKRRISELEAKLNNLLSEASKRLEAAA